MIPGMVKWAQAVINFHEEVKKARKALTVDEIELVKKVLKSVLIMIYKHDNNKSKDLDD